LTENVLILNIMFTDIQKNWVQPKLQVSNEAYSLVWELVSCGLSSTAVMLLHFGMVSHLSWNQEREGIMNTQQESSSL